MTPHTNNKIYKLLGLWLPPLVWAVVIFSFSQHPTVPVSEIHVQDFIVKKSMHILEYAILTLLLFRALVAKIHVSKKAVVLAFGISVLYGITDEYHQSFTPGREPTLRDVGFDALGALSAACILINVIPKTSGFVKNLAIRLGLTS